MSTIKSKALSVDYRAPVSVPATAEASDLDFSVFPKTRSVIDCHGPALACISDPTHLSQYLKAHRELLIAQITAEQHSNAPALAPRSGIETSHEFSDLIDAVVRRMFVMACAATDTNPETLPIAIVATGGYGRRELAPFSDIDITFIPQRDGDARTDRVVKDLFRLVMDVFIAKSGLEVGYAYRLLSDCTTLDHQTACGLMDARHVAGNVRLFIQFEDAFWTGFNATEFIFTKIDERNAMLKKWGAVPRSVEPQLKEGPGGLRDLQTSVWLLQAREHMAAARVRGNRGLTVLCKEAGLGEESLSALTRAKETIFRVRNALHAVCGAERDQLAVTRQEEVARLLGYVTETNGSVPPVERFMADLFPALALCRATADRVMRFVSNSRLMLGIGLDAVNRQIVPANESIDVDDPVWMAWACELSQRYALPLSDELKDAALLLLQAGAETRQSEEMSAVFTQILTRVGSVYPILQAMADLGVLTWILPEFNGLMDLIPYDASHDFTVGQHSLFVVRALEELVQNLPTVPGADNEDKAEMRRTLEDLAHPEYLMLAALIHDAGKSTPGLPHAEQSALLVDGICRRLHWPEEAAGHVQFLVRNHLLMGDTSRLRDLNMEKTIRDFVSVADDMERLNMLYLLTYADTKAVGDGIWTPVKGKFLRELWQRASSVLFDQDPAAGYEEAVADARRKIKRDLTLEKYDAQEIEEHIAAMPPYYLLNSTQQEVALHLEFVRRVRRGEIVIDFHDERSAPYTEMTICTVDDPEPGLLSKIAVVLLAASLNVHSARVVTRQTERDRIALDTLLVDYKGRPLTGGKRQEVSNNLKAILNGARLPSEMLPRKRPTSRNALKQLAPAATERTISVDHVSHDLDEGISLIDVSGPVALDLFYRICTAVSGMGWNIQSAKLSASRDVLRANMYVLGARQYGENEIKKLLGQALERVAINRI